MNTIKSFLVKTFILCLCFCLVCGCKGEETLSTVSSVPSEHQSAPEQDIMLRWYSERTESLIPLAEYGSLVPFVGGYYEQSVDGKKETTELYGLCNLDGKIVVDGVYTSVKLHSLDASSYILELTLGDGNDAKTFLASGTGSWIFELPKGTKLTDNIGGGRIMLERSVTKQNKTIVYHDFYDGNGKLVFTYDKAQAEDVNTSYKIGRFSDGYAPVNVVVTEPVPENEKNPDGEKVEPNKLYSAFFIDTSGKKVYDNFKFCEEFIDGFAIVTDTTGNMGIINTKGEYFIEPQFRKINYNAQKGLYSCGTDEYFDIIDKSGNKLKRVLSDKGNVEVLGKDKLIYKKTNAYTGRSEYFYADTSTPFTHTSTGQFPDENGNLNGYYVCSYGGSASVFDESGQTVISANDFGRLETVCAEAIVISNKDLTKTAVVRPGVTKKLEWIDMAYDSRETIGNRYIILNSTVQGEKVYSLYDVQTGQVLFNQSDSISIVKMIDTQYLLIVNNGKTRVCDSSLNNVLLFPLAV